MDRKDQKFVKKYDPAHPYCTNWPMTKKDEEKEFCIRCGKETSYKKSDNIEFRSGYIEGSGQLCFECTHLRRLHRQGDYGD